MFIRLLFLSIALFLYLPARTAVKMNFEFLYQDDDKDVTFSAVPGASVLSVLCYYVVDSEGNIVVKDSLTTIPDRDFSCELIPGNYTIYVLGQGKENAYLGVRYDLQSLKTQNSLWLQTWQEARHAARFDYYYTRHTFTVKDKPLTCRLVLKRITGQFAITLSKSNNTNIGSLSVGFDKGCVYNGFTADSTWRIGNETIMAGRPDAILETAVFTDGKYRLNSFPGKGDVSGRIYISYTTNGVPFSKTVPFTGIRIKPNSRTFLHVDL